MKKFLCTIIPVLIIMSTFSGCSPELYQRLIVKGMAIDMSGEEFKLTVRVMDFAEKGEKLMESTGRTVYDALMNLSLESGKKPMYSHSYYIIFGKSAGEGGIEKSIDFFVRYFKAQPTVKLFIAEGEGAEVVKAKSGDKLISSEDINELENSQSNCGLTVSTDLVQFVSDSKGIGRTSVIPIIGTDGESVFLKDTALIKNYIVVGYLSGEETLGYLTANSKIKHGPVVSDAGDYGKITGELRSAKSDISFGEEDYTVNIKTEADCTLASATFGREINRGDYEELESIISEKIRGQMSDALTLAYSKNCDILYLGHKKYMEQPKEWRSLQENWDSMLPAFSFNIEVSVSFDKTGEENRPPKL